MVNAMYRAFKSAGLIDSESGSRISVSEGTKRHNLTNVLRNANINDYRITHFPSKARVDEIWSGPQKIFIYLLDKDHGRVLELFDISSLEKDSSILKVEENSPDYRRIQLNEDRNNQNNNENLVPFRPRKRRIIIP